MLAGYSASVASARSPLTHFPQCLQEMFRQGDRERAAGMPISPLMDRSKGGVTKSQTGFFNIVALPLFTVRRTSLP